MSRLSTSNNNTNNTNNTNNNKNTYTEQRGTTMKNNTIRENRAKEAAQKAEQKKIEAKERLLAQVQPVDLVETMDEVYNNTAHTVRNEDGDMLGVGGGALYQIPYTGKNGELKTIAAASREEALEIQEQIENGLSGDGKYHRLVYIGGCPCECVGNTPEELEQDILAAEMYAKAHRNGSLLRDLDIAEQLCDAGYRQEDLEQVAGPDGKRYLLCYDGSYIMDTTGRTIVSLDDIHSPLNDADVKTLLVERLNRKCR